MPANYAGYSPDYGQTPPDYDEVGINSVDEALGRIARSVKNRFVYGPGKPPPDVGMYNAPKPLPITEYNPFPRRSDLDENTTIVPWAPGPSDMWAKRLSSVLSPDAEKPVATMTNPAAMTDPAATPSSNQIRAIKMPNGRIQFTNVGTESTPEGDKPKRGTWTDYGQAASQFRNEQYREPDSPTDSALVKASHRARSNNPGSIEAGSVSSMPGTDEQKRGLELETAAGLSAIAKAQFERSAYGAREHVMQQEANLTPRERAEMASKNLMETEYMTNWATSEHKMNERSRIADEAAISSSFPPGSPEFHDAMDRISKRYRANELRILQHSRRAPLSQSELGLWEDLDTNPDEPATR